MILFVSVIMRKSKNAVNFTDKKIRRLRVAWKRINFLRA
jgi:hypothetical protein